jgi:truncated hemoglobin YjbI
METPQLVNATGPEDLTPAQREQWLDFYRQAMQRKRAVQAEIRAQANNPDFWQAVEPLLTRNRDRGTPFV